VVLRGKFNGAKPGAEAMGGATFGWCDGRGAFCQRGRSTGRTAGAGRSENAGMSSVKIRENRVRRKSKVSDARSIRVGLVGNIPEPCWKSDEGTQRGRPACEWLCRWKRVGVETGRQIHPLSRGASASP